MQPKFTLRELGYLGLRFIALALIFSLSAHLSFSQEQRQVTPKKITKEEQSQLLKNKILVDQGKIVSPLYRDNDASLPNNRLNQSATQRTEAICQTFNGSLAAGDLTMGNRYNRDGVQGACPLGKTFNPTTFSGTFFYDTYTWTNNSGLTQCANFSLSTTDAASNIEFAVHLGSFDPTNLGLNFVTDPGLSSGTPPNVTSCGYTVAAGATLVFVVFSPNTGGTCTDYTLTIDLPLCSSTPCSGTPAPGNTLSSANPVCPGINFTLSLQNNPPVAGLTYQWQSSPDNATWTNITGATAAALVRNQTAATWYRCQVTCSGNTGTSTPVQVTMNPPSSCYCTPGTTDCTDNDVITRVRISTLDNSSACGSGPPPGYSDYTTSVPAPLVYSGAPNPITLDLPPNWSEGLAAWIDYNQNGQFEASEYTLIGNKPAGQTTISANINIPTTALTGITRMRVRCRFAAVLGSGDACIGYTFGETEDYNVNITPCVQGVFTAHPPNRSIQCSNNTTFTVTTTGSLLTYAWEYRTSSSGPWQNAVNGGLGGVISGATTSTLTLTNVPQTLNGYQFRALIQGGCTAIDFSNPGTLTVTPLVATVNPSSATICTGTIQQLTLTNAASPATATFTATGLPIAIPDANPTGINNTIPVSLPGGSVISRIDVKFSIPAHTWAGDLCVVLKAPNGQVLNLDYFISGTGFGPTSPGMVNTVISSAGTALLSSTSNPWTGTFRADAATSGSPAPGPTGFIPTTNSWSALYSVPSGNWTLAVYDAFGGDVGSLTAWSMDITYGAQAQGVWTGPAGTMWTNAGATTAYVAGSLANTIYVNPTVTSNYTVVYSTATPCTSNPTVIPVNVVNPVSAVVNPTNKSVCVGGNTSFTVSATGGPIAYQWQVSVDGGVTWSNIATGTSATLNLNGVTQLMNNNRYRALLTAAPCAGTTTSGVAILTVNPLPNVTISATDIALAPTQTSTITGSSTPAAASGGWSWTLNGAGISGNGNTQTVNVDGMGVYQATVTDVNGCVNKSNELEIGAEASDKLWIYPNPTPGSFQVRLYYDSDVAEKRVITIYNMLGQSIMSKEFTLVDNTPPYLQMNFDLSHMARGTYVVKVAHKYTGKVVSGLVLIQ